MSTPNEYASQNGSGGGGEACEPSSRTAPEEVVGIAPQLREPGRLPKQPLRVMRSRLSPGLAGDRSASLCRMEHGRSETAAAALVSPDSGYLKLLALTIRRELESDCAALEKRRAELSSGRTGRD